MDKELEVVALEAVLKHKKSKLYAKVNHEDNFSLVMAPVARDAIMEELGLLDTADDVDWINEMCRKPYGKSVDYLDAFARNVSRTAYQQLRA